MAPRDLLPTDLSVDEAMRRGLEFRHAVASGDRFPLVLQNQNEVADVLHAACRSLMDDCVKAPRQVLSEASTIRELLEMTLWPNDELEEKESLLTSLAFIGWRAARILELSREVHLWEGEYKRGFRVSLARRAMDNSFTPDGAVDALSSEPESFFQALTDLSDNGEAYPKEVLNVAKEIYHLLESGEVKFPDDLHFYLLGEAARVAGGVLRAVGNESEVERWLDVAEEHFREGVNPRPGLARILYQRLIGSYSQCRLDVVTSVAPQLEAALAELGMEEDRVKCRITWAASLKMLGHFEQAIQVLEPLKKSREQIRPSLYGWVLLHSGDLNQLAGDYDRALEELLEAGKLLREGGQFTGLADVKSMISGIYRAHGRLEEAVWLLRSSEQEHAQLGMKSLVANNRVLIAETYLAMGKPREAEIEIRAALPILEEQGMLADAVIAVNLLREAVRQRKLDPGESRDSWKPKK